MVLDLYVGQPLEHRKERKLVFLTTVKADDTNLITSLSSLITICCKFTASSLRISYQAMMTGRKVNILC